MTASSNVSMADLPPEVRELFEAEEAARAIKLEAFGSAIAKKRDAAVAFRQASGIEDEWRDDEEQYQGIDDANRNEAKMVKSPTTTGGLYSQLKQRGSRSTVFLNITRPYVDAAAAEPR